MREQTKLFLKKFLDKHGVFKDALEVGSFDVNGTIKEVWNGSPYLGIDMRNGPNVGEVVNGHNLKKHFGDRKFDLIICFDTLEHDNKFWLTIENIREILKPGGYLLIGVPGRNCSLHGHPDDYWRFMPSGVQVFFEEYEDVQILPEGEDEVYASGRKPL